MSTETTFASTHSCPGPRLKSALDSRFVVSVGHGLAVQYARRVHFPAGKLYGVGSLDEAEIIPGSRVPVVIMALLSEHPLNTIRVLACE